MVVFGVSLWSRLVPGPVFGSGLGPNPDWSLDRHLGQSPGPVPGMVSTNRPLGGWLGAGLRTGSGPTIPGPVLLRERERKRERERERERGERERERESQWLSNVGRMPSPDDRLHTQRDPACTKKVNVYCLQASLDDVETTSKAVGLVFCSPAQSFTLPPDPVFVSDDVLVLI